MKRANQDTSLTPLDHLDHLDHVIETASRARSLGWLLAAAVLGGPVGSQVVTTQAAGGASHATPQVRTNDLPTIESSLPSESDVHIGQEIRFSVTVDDADGDAVWLRLLNPPPGLVFHPVVAGASPAAVEVSWSVPAESGGPRRLVFEAHDDAQPSKRTRLERTVRVLGTGDSAIVTGDVTGDGRLDVVVAANFADLAAGNNGAVYVWAGAAMPAGAPSAILSVPGSVNGDRLGESGQGLHLAEVTGDGVLDVVAGSHLVDEGGLMDTGAVYVWAGGAGLSGSVAPTASLSVPGATEFDSLGNSSGQGVLLVDVTGDGTTDLVVGTQSATIGGNASQGAVYVWVGGAGLVGAPAPTATLIVPGGSAFDSLGGGVTVAQGVQAADVSGDGVRDIVATAQEATIGGVSRAGAIYVWNGGPGLASTPAPSAALTVPGATDLDKLGYGQGPGVQLADVTGDQVLDVVASAIRANATASDSGAVYVFYGGASLTGAVAPGATCSVAGAADQDFLGDAAGHGVVLGDLTGDGVLDILAGARFAEVGAGLVNNRGAVYVFAGGAGMSGAVGPHATLTVPGAAQNDQLGHASGQGIQLGDLTGDGQLDVIVGAQNADVNAVDDGALYVFRGGASLTGSLGPTAVLAVPGSEVGDGLAGGGGLGFQLADITGDGLMDAVAAAGNADPSGTVDAGAVYVFAGSVGLSGAVAPAALLSSSSAAIGDGLSHCDGQGIWLADVTGDGSLDIVAGAQLADVGDVDTGALYVFAGGPGLSGTTFETARLRVAGAAAGDQLGVAFGQGVQIADLNGDGVPDVIAGSYLADAGASDAGAVHVWLGGALSGTTSPHASLVRAGALAGDNLGDASGQGIQLADVTGDGLSDVIVGARFADLALVDTGVVELWKGGASLSGTPAPTATLANPGALANDRLGQN